MGVVPGAGDAGTNAAGGNSTASLGALTAELAQKQQFLRKREQEGESLRARLRKLAMV